MLDYKHLGHTLHNSRTSREEAQYTLAIAVAHSTPIHIAHLHGNEPVNELGSIKTKCNVFKRQEKVKKQRSENVLGRSGRG